MRRIIAIAAILAMGVPALANGFYIGLCNPCQPIGLQYQIQQTSCTIGHSSSIIMANSCQVGWLPCIGLGIQTHAVMACTIAWPQGPQVDCSMSLSVNGQQIILQMP